ncbi:Non-specific serine/threonine protein kinase [Aphelenchoides fujianensis]|nr:Non-specific serine/threonine protein kinase [Aphelenchoides fujianensis]
MAREFADEDWMASQYLLLGRLGEGGFGKVHTAIHSLTGEKVAIKSMSKAKLGRDLPHVYQEIEALKNLLHQNICRLFQVVETPTKIYLVLEHCEGGEMFDYIVRRTRLSEPEARHFFRQLVMAIAYAHKQGYVHRDLKPENLLLKDPLQLKVIDFGPECAQRPAARDLLRQFGLRRSGDHQGECSTKNKPYDGPSADIWSMGVLLYILVCGSPPFNSDDQAALTKSIVHGKYSFPTFLSPDCQNLLQRMMTVDLKQRITMDEDHRPSKNMFNESIVREMAGGMEMTYDEMLKDLEKWKYDYNTATYLIMLQCREQKQPLVLPNFNRKHVVNSPTFHGSLESMGTHSSAGGSGSDAKNDVAFLHTPQARKHVLHKENMPPPRNPHAINVADFCTPRRPTQPEVTYARPQLGRRGGSLPRSAKPADRKAPLAVRLPESPSPRSDALKTPTKSSDARKSRSTEKSPRMGRLFASLERKAPRVFEMITPRRMRQPKDDSVVKVCKRKRIRGDAFKYKRVCEEILKMAGL